MIGLQCNAAEALPGKVRKRVHEKFSFELISIQFAVKGASADAEPLCRLGPIPSAFIQSPLDQHFFIAFEIADG